MSRSRQQRTRRRARAFVRRILVVSEGLVTERQYVERLNGYLRSRDSSVTVKSVGVGADPLKVVNKCIEEQARASAKGAPFDTCVALVDVDQHSTILQALETATNNSIQVLISNLKFEVWLRWHVEDKRSALSSKQLDKLCTDLKLLRNGKHLPPDFPISNVDQACGTARLADPELSSGRTGPNPSTAMPVLVDLIRGHRSGSR